MLSGLLVFVLFYRTGLEGSSPLWARSNGSVGLACQQSFYVVQLGTVITFALISF